MTEIRYTLTVYLTQPVGVGEDPTAYHTRESLRILEKQVIKALGKLDGDADCEVMTYDILRDGPYAPVVEKADV